MDYIVPLFRRPPRRMALRRSIPRWFLHENLQTPIKPFFSRRSRSLFMDESNDLIDFYVNYYRTSNRSLTSHGCIELIPLDVKTELSQKMFFTSLCCRDASSVVL